MSKPKILFYDIETTPIRAYVWRLGKQVVRHGQLSVDHYITNIICITYCWNDGKKAKALVFDYETQNCKKVVQDFDELCKKADVIIGKNNMKFDNKQITTQRLLHDLPGMPDWLEKMDDLERHMRKHFALPSYGLDYFSDILGLGGKINMCMQDWINIVEKNEHGKASLKKMVEYGKKDIEDTRAIWNHCVKHFKPRYNHATHSEDHVCTNCGSNNIRKNGTRVAGKGKKQSWYCNDHGGFAGYTIINWKSGKEKVGN